MPNHNLNNDNFQKLTENAIDTLRKKLLDLTKRNNLLNFKENAKSIRIVDELPNQVFESLVSNSSAMELIPYYPPEKTTIELKLDSLHPSPEQLAIEYSLDVDQINFILEKVKTLGSIEAVKASYSKVSKVRDVALDYAYFLEAHNYPAILSSCVEDSVTCDVLLENELPKDQAERSEKHLDLFLQTPFIPKQLEKKCTTVSREYVSALNETGANFLYLAMGFLEWSDSDDSEQSYKAPLVLLPIEIEKKRVDRVDQLYSYNISFSVEFIEANLSLREKLDTSFGLKLPQWSEDSTPEDYFALVAEAVRLRKGWKILREMVIGFFSFSKLRLYKDLDDSVWPSGESPLVHETVRELLIGKDSSNDTGLTHGEERLYPSIDDNCLPLVMKADGSQIETIQRVLHTDENIVVHGPPGTGKSQTITNLIAAALSQKKTVLFISEKKAALEVVRKRLNSVNLGDFCLELHSHKTQKGQLHADLERRLNKEFSRGNGFERKLLEKKRHQSRLIAYYSALTSKQGTINKSAYEIFGKAEFWKTKFGEFYVSFEFPDALSANEVDINYTSDLIAEFARVLDEVDDNTIAVWTGYYPNVVLESDETRIKSLIQMGGVATQQLLDQISKVNEAPTCTMKKLNDIAAMRIEDFPAVSDKWLISVAPCLSRAQTRSLLREMCYEVSSFRALNSEISRVVGADYQKKEILTEEVAESARQLDLAGLGDWDIGKLLKFNNVSEKIRKQINQLAEAVEETAPLFHHFRFSVEQLELVQRAAAYFNGIPPSFGNNAYQHHASDLACQYVMDADFILLQYQTRLESLEATFNISKTPSCSKLSGLVECLSSKKGFLSKLFSSDYRQAKRDFRSFYMGGKCSSEQIINNLEELIAVKELALTFEANPNYQAVLGSCFNGVDTDWEALVDQILRSKQIAKLLGSELAGKRFLSDFDIKKDVFLFAAEKIDVHLEELMSLLNEFKLLGVSTSDDLADVTHAVEVLGNKVERFLPALLEVKELSGLTVNNIRTIVKHAHDAQVLFNKIEGNEDYKLTLGADFKGIDTAIDVISEMNEWASAVVDQHSVEESLLQWLLSDSPAMQLEVLKEVVDHCRTALVTINESIDGLAELGDLDLAVWLGHPLDECTLERLYTKFQETKKLAMHLRRWTLLQHKKKDLLQVGLAEVITYIEKKRLDAPKSSAFYQAVMYESMARDLVRTHPQLRDFQGVVFEQVRSTLRVLDEELEQVAQQQIASNAAKHIVPQGVSSGRVRNYTELSLIEHELKKRRGHIPVRQLVKRSVKALLGLKPCFMMSPMSVAQYLEPGKIKFDLVVMDEASQLKLEDALGAVLRGRQIVVVGDPKQLPPTSFFQQGVNAAGDDGVQADDAESILEVAQNSFRNEKLKWHYRSQDESLIAFSNTKFYDGELVVFPTPNHNSATSGVFRHYVNDAYSQKRGNGVVNRLEAAQVAEAIKSHFLNYDELSLGVATFNASQCELIQDELDRLCREDKVLEDKIKRWEETPESFFIKNLENVQGDERDVIFISTTYGPDKDSGKVFQRFGPINSETGWRRLNVIITRAKHQLHLFTSLLSTDIKMTATSHRGVIVFRDYLEFLETGLIPDWGALNPEKEPDSPFEIAVAHALNQHGYKTAYQVGVSGFFIDIGVYAPGSDSEFILGVECDGATYHSDKSVRDNDVLRQDILESKGWNIHRVWSTDWFKNREYELKKLLARLEEITSSRTVVAAPHKERSISVDMPVQHGSEQAEDTELREALKLYRENKMQVEHQAELGETILSDCWIDRFVKYKPINKEQFYNIPEDERATAFIGAEYFDDIFELIEDFS